MLVVEHGDCDGEKHYVTVWVREGNESVLGVACASPSCDGPELTPGQFMLAECLDLVYW